LQNPDWITCWTIIQTISSFGYFAGMGFSNSLRTIVCIQIGEGRNKEAKRSTYLGLALISVFGIVLVLLFNLLRTYIASIFVKSGTEMHDLLADF